MEKSKRFETTNVMGVIRDSLGPIAASEKNGIVIADPNASVGKRIAESMREHGGTTVRGDEFMAFPLCLDLMWELLPLPLQLMIGSPKIFIDACNEQLGIGYVPVLCFDCMPVESEFFERPGAVCIIRVKVDQSALN